MRICKMDKPFQFYLKREGWPITDLVAYCPGFKKTCSRCKSDKICIFFKPGFIGKETSKWCEYMDEGNFELCDDYKIILTKNYNPNWICKSCYNGGVII